jgi:truncated hemoglobin YjbI
MMRLRAALPLIAALVLASAGCHRKQVEHPTPKDTTPPAPQPTPSIAAPVKPRPPVSLKILSPREGETLSARGASASVTFSLSGYELQNDGQHLHVVLDNHPYEPYYDLSKPFTFKNPIPPGTHTIRAFLVGGPMTEGVSLHESLKEPGAFAMTTFVVGKADAKNTVTPGDPLLTFSEPRGEYIGEQARRIMLDFWVQGASLGPEAYKVKYTVNGGRETTLTEWKKTSLVGLPLGESIVEVWLVGPDNQEVSGPFNRVTRKITLKEFAPRPLFERLGGMAAIEALVSDLLRFISEDDVINKRFAKTDISRLQAQLNAQLCELTGGPCDYEGRSMKAAHRRMKINGKEFEALLGDVALALKKNKIPEQEQREVLEALSAMRPQIVEK